MKKLFDFADDFGNSLFRNPDIKLGALLVVFLLMRFVAGVTWLDALLVGAMIMLGGGLIIFLLEDWKERGTKER